MTPIILLFAIGVLLLAFEVFLPGAVLGIVGGVAMLGGCVLAFVHFGAAGGLGATLGAVLILGLTLYLEVVLLPRTKFGRNLFVHATVHATSQPPVATDTVVGHTGRALTTLAPSGYVLVEGKRYEAFSRSGHIEKGASLRVVGLDNFRLIVSKPEIP
jgi:membrane-bound ClpP family serine protease